MSNDSTDDGVGYGRPPKQHQFKKGQSGNPKGRPRVQKSFATLVADALDVRIPIQEAGKRRLVRKSEVVARQLTNKAAAGDHRAMKLVMDIQASPQWKAATDLQTQAVKSPHEEIMRRYDEIQARLIAAGDVRPPDSAN